VPELLALLLVEVGLALAHRSAVAALVVVLVHLRVFCLSAVQRLRQQVFVLLQELEVESPLAQLLQDVGLRSAPASVLLHAEPDGLRSAAIVGADVGPKHELGRLWVVATMVDLREDEVLRTLDAFVRVESTPHLPEYSSP